MRVQKVLGRIALVDRDADDLELVFAEFSVESVQQRHLGNARRTPGSPKIQNERLFAPIIDSSSTRKQGLHSVYVNGKIIQMRFGFQCLAHSDPANDSC